MVSVTPSDQNRNLVKVQDAGVTLWGRARGREAAGAARLWWPASLGGWEGG